MLDWLTGRQLAAISLGPTPAQEGCLVGGCWLQKPLVCWSSGKLMHQCSGSQVWTTGLMQRSRGIPPVWPVIICTPPGSDLDHVVLLGLLLQLLTWRNSIREVLYF